MILIRFTVLVLCYCFAAVAAQSILLDCHPPLNETNITSDGRLEDHVEENYKGMIYMGRLDENGHRLGYNVDNGENNTISSRWLESIHKTFLFCFRPHVLSFPLLQVYITFSELPSVGGFKQIINSSNILSVQMSFMILQIAHITAK